MTPRGSGFCIVNETLFITSPSPNAKGKIIFLLSICILDFLVKLPENSKARQRAQEPKYYEIKQQMLRAPNGARLRLLAGFFSYFSTLNFGKSGKNNLKQ